MPLSWSWVTDCLSGARSYWLCTTRPDGRPHAAPVWAVWDDDRLVLSTGRGSVKGRDIARDPRVAVHQESGEEVVVCEGALVELPAADVPEDLHAAYGKKYGAGPDGRPFRLDLFPPEEAGIWQLRPTVVLAWTERDFEASRTRFTPGQG